MLVKALVNWSSVNLPLSYSRELALYLSLKISLLSTATGSLLIFSSLHLLRCITSLQTHSCAYFYVNLWLLYLHYISSYLVGIFHNASIFSGYFFTSLSSGLNVRYITHKLLDCTYISCLVGIGLILRTTLNGRTNTRSINALSLSSFSNRIMHIGSRSSLSTLGLIGLKIALVN